jgi:hypothetical protein
MARVKEMAQGEATPTIQIMRGGNNNGGQGNGSNDNNNNNSNNNNDGDCRVGNNSLLKQL